MVRITMVTITMHNNFIHNGLILMAIITRGKSSARALYTSSLFRVRFLATRSSFRLTRGRELPHLCSKLSISCRYYSACNIRRTTQAVMKVHCV